MGNLSPYRSGYCERNMLYMAFFDAANGASKKTMSNHLSWIHTNQCCCKRADGRWIKQNSNDQATLNGMPVAILQKLVKAVESPLNLI
jgi:hypothetical protein